MSKETVRLSIDCSREERKKLKILSSMADCTMSDWVMSAVRQRIAKEIKKLPNKKTRDALIDSQQGKGVKKHNNIEELFEDLGI